MLGFCIFTIGCAVAKDVQTLMLCRYFAGFFSASPLAVVPACFSDMFDNRQRGLAITAFAAAVFLGPFASPFIGGFIVISDLGWRWTMYISAILGFLGLGLMLFYQETYQPAILVAKAGRLRRQTHDWRIHAKQEEIEVDFHELLANNFGRPLRMLVTEPIVLLITIYMSFIYGLMYAFLGAYPLVFQGVHGMNPGVGGLPFLGLVIGEFFAAAYIMLLQGSYNKKLDANGDVPIPEWRLPPVMVGAVCFAAGLFW
jgi:DHA1 family multidrug resistance protein-like MFS transporter